MHFISAHAPFVTPRSFFDLYDPEDIPPPIRFGASERSEHPSVVHLRQIVPHEMDLPLTQVQALRAAYFATVRYLDALVGQVLDALNTCGHAENTLVIYTSDHGFSLGDHYIFGLFHLFEESLKVPLIMAGPGVPHDVRCDTPVSHVDLFPTIIEAAGVAAEPKAPSPLGRSLWPLLRGTAQNRDPVFAEYHGTATQTGGYVLRDGRLKLIHFPAMPPQLFDLKVDPDEAHNLANDPAHADTLARMMSLLRERVDPDAVDRAAKAAQRALIAKHGGKDAVLRKMGGFSYSPPPGMRWQDMDGNRDEPES